MATEARIRALIADDEPHARTRLRQLLHGEADVLLVGEAGNGAQAVELIQKERPDVVFLDIQMPRMTGIELCEALVNSKSEIPFVVFVTAYDQYALKAFEVHAIDYLLKPFDRERFQKTMVHIREVAAFRTPKPDESALKTVLHELAEMRRGDRLVFKQNGKVIFIRMELIDWIEADGNYVRIHAGTEAHYIRETLAAIENQLPASRFMRVSRSALVNLDRVKELQPMFYGEYTVVLHNGAKVNMSRSYKDRLDDLLGRDSA